MAEDRPSLDSMVDIEFDDHVELRLPGRQLKVAVKACVLRDESYGRYHVRLAHTNPLTQTPAKRADLPLKSPTWNAYHAAVEGFLRSLYTPRPGELSGGATGGRYAPRRKA